MLYKNNTIINFILKLALSLFLISSFIVTRSISFSNTQENTSLSTSVIRRPAKLVWVRVNESNAITKSALLSLLTQNWTLKKLILFAHHHHRHHHRLHPTDQQWPYSFIQKYTISFYSLHPLHLSYHTHPSFPFLLSTNSLFFIWSFFSLSISDFFAAMLYPSLSQKTWPSFLIIFYHSNWLSFFLH